MSAVIGDELAVVGGPDLDADLAALLMLDEYALQNDLDGHPWPAVAPATSRQLEQAPSTPTTVDMEESKLSPDSPCSVDTDDTEFAEERERRRRRHRESMARYRQERRDRVDGMKDQEMALQRILTQVLAHNKHIDDGSGNKTALQRYQAKFTELIRLRETLLMEKRDLTDKVMLHDQRARAFQSISDQMFSKSIFVFPRTPGGVWLRYEENDVPFYYEPVQEEVCRKTIAIGLQKMSELLRSLPQDFLPRPMIDKTQLLGWNIERAFTKTDQNVPVMLFRFSQRVSKHQATLELLEERSWRIYTSPDVMNQSSASNVRTQLVQQVTDDIVIMIRNAPEKKSAGRSRYLSLYHKMRSGRDQRTGRCSMIFTMLMNRAPKEEMPDISSSVRSTSNWLKDGCALLRFTEKPTTPSNRDGGIDVEYMGYVECRDVMHGDHMWTELCLLMLLWGQAVVPQRLLPA